MEVKNHFQRLYNTLFRVDRHSKVLKSLLTKNRLSRG